jgi:hypothetical protein
MSTLVATNKGTLTNPAQQQRRLKKTDRHLLVMLLFQIVILTLLSVPYIILEIYTSLTASQYKTPLQAAIVNFAFNFALLLIYLCGGIPFYIYTLCGGSVFRNALLDIVKNSGRMMMRCLPV